MFAREKAPRMNELNGTERTLLALADPIRWAEQAKASGYGRWHATLDWVEYQIADYRTADTSIDKLHSPCPWLLTVQVTDKHGSGMVHATSLEEAKRFALHHYCTRDLTEIKTIHAGQVAAYQAAYTTYETLWRNARANIVERFLAHKTPYLTTDSSDRSVPEFRMSGHRGNYHARFDWQRRWVVTYTRPDKTTEERCFLARAFVEMGCSYHAHKGEWRGLLRANQKPLADYRPPDTGNTNDD